MTAKLATADDHILAGLEDAGAMRDGSVVHRRASDRSQGGFTQFDSGYLSPYFVTDPEHMEVTFENASAAGRNNATMTAHREFAPPDQ